MCFVCDLIWDSSVSGCRESSSYGDRSVSEDLPYEALGHQRGSGQVQVLVLDEIRVDVASQRASKGRIAGKKTEDVNRLVLMTFGSILANQDQVLNLFIFI
ncbi:hypothetical protein ACSBR1_006209 [Camellia fascicularis]